MPYKGFVGAGTVGHFFSVTDLQNRFPADTYAGRRATVEVVAGSATQYYSDGLSWKSVPVVNTDPLTGRVTALVGPDGLPISVVQTYTLAQMLALASPVDGQRVIVSDITTMPVFVYDLAAAKWVSANRFQLAGSAVALIQPSSGVIGANGALTSLTTALPRVYPRCWMYFPANAIGAGVAAGTYYVEMTTTSAGTIFNNTMPLNGNTDTPTTKVPFSGTAGSSYTQVNAADYAIHTCTIKGGLLGRNGDLTAEYAVEVPNNANTKNFKPYYGNAQFGTHQASGLGGNNFRSVIQNAGATNSQIGNVNNSSGYNGSSLQIIGGSVDSTADWQHELRVNMAVPASDYVIISRFTLTANRA